MAKPRRSFSVEQKLQIIQEADQQGGTQTLRKHNLSHSVFLRWKHQFDQGGSAIPVLSASTAAEGIRIVRTKLVHLFYRIPRATLASWLNMEPVMEPETFSRDQ